MTAPPSRLRRCANTLGRLTRYLLPDARVEWSRAMQSEIHHLQDDREAFAWAIGCATTACAERMRAMTTSTRKIAPWILGSEMLLCFVPLSWMLLELASEPHYATERGALYAALLFAAALGPVGLIVALRAIVLQRVSLPPLATGALLAATLLGIAVFGSLYVSEGQFLQNWQGYALLTLVPAAGVAHLLTLARETRTDQPA